MEHERIAKALEFEVQAAIPQEKEWPFVTCGSGGCRTTFVKESELTQVHKNALVGGVIKEYQYLPEELQLEVLALLVNSEL